MAKVSVGWLAGCHLRAESVYGQSLGAQQRKSWTIRSRIQIGCLAISKYLFIIGYLVRFHSVPTSSQQLSPYQFHSKMATYQPLDASKNEIRLLTVHPNDNDDDETVRSLISCELFHVSLDDKDARFIAISYVWGDPLETREILVNGQVHLVTINCWEILCAHSCIPEYEGIPIWIDALCINQDDVAEREREVLRMHKIYPRGLLEISLGMCADDMVAMQNDELAIKALETLAKGFTSDVEDDEDDDDNSNDSVGMEREDGGSDSEAEDENTINNSLEHIYHFLNKPWFSRMWIVQEFALGSDIPSILIWGYGYAIDAIILANACWELSHWNASVLTGERIVLLIGVARYLRLSLATELLSSQDPSYDDIFLRLLCIYRDQLASDPRDKVYSLLKLLQISDGDGNPEAISANARSKKFDQQSLPVDYTASVEDVYARTVKSVVIATGRLDIICACQQPTDFCRTWTPDWRQPWSRLSLNSVAAFLMQEENLFHASASMNAGVTFSDDLRVLCLRGILHSTVCRVSTKWSSRSIEDVPDVHEELSKLSDFYPGMKGYGREDSNEDNERAVSDDESHENESMDDSSSDGSGEGSGNPWDRLAQAMLGGLCAKLACGKTASFEHPFIFFPGRNAAWCERAWKSDAFTAQLIRMGEGRRTMRTDSGSLGSGPEELEVGNLVCVLFGCSVPVILRRVDDHYIFIGECYVHEIMQGQLVEALNRGDVSEQVFDIH